MGLQLYFFWSDRQSLTKRNWKKTRYTTREKPPSFVCPPPPPSSSSSSPVSPTSRVTVLSGPARLQVSGPAARDKAAINCRPVRRARGTKEPTRCPCPQTRPETNVTEPAQNGIIRPVSLNTFTYLRVLSDHCFVLAQEEGRAWMEGGAGGGQWAMRNNTRRGGRRTKQVLGFHSDGLGS